MNESTHLTQRVSNALGTLLKGAPSAIGRSDDLRLEKEGDLLYSVLLSIVLRLVFFLCAESRLNNKKWTGSHGSSVHGLHDELVSNRDTGCHKLNNRHGAFGELQTRFRALVGGDLFPFSHCSDSNWRYLEFDDDTVLQVLENLLFSGNHREDYRTIDAGMIGTVYEQLMGFFVVGITSPEQPSGTPDTLVTSKGGLAIQPGSDRRRTGSHYTPRDLAEKTVRRALEPIISSLGGRPSSDTLLNLRVCDPAMGSGVFLVEACRFLADLLVTAWIQEGANNCENGQLLNRARRLIIERCLYGVDRNPFAVDLAGLSLWLMALDEEEPRPLGKHNLRHGDSLVGLSLTQLARFHWEPTPDDEPLISRSDPVTYRSKLGGDLIVGSFFDCSHPKERENERDRRLLLLQEFPGDRERLSQESELVRTRADDQDDALRECKPRRELTQLQRSLHTRVPAFHWPLEFPEIFGPPECRDGVGFDAIVGNPPFLGGRRIRGLLGDTYIEWLDTYFGASKNADLCAHFFRRAGELVRDGGTIGFIATNTIAEGDTRLVGLKHLVDNGFSVYDATTNASWPGDAVVSVSLVHLIKGSPEQTPTQPILNGQTVGAINSRLRSGPERADPKRLPENEALCFQGSVLASMGFVLSPAERTSLIEKNPKNAECISPYIGGNEVNSTPTQIHHRYVINFGARSLQQAENWPDLSDLVRQRVKPQRDKARRDAHRRYWWQYGDKRPALLKALEPLKRCLVTARHSKHLMFSFQPTDRVMSEALCVFALESFAHFALLQSRIHEVWARLLSSTLGEGLRYVPTDCFLTFPFPPPGKLSRQSNLERAGRRFYKARASFMTEQRIGLTKTHNLMSDPGCSDDDVEKLRTLHCEMDRAVATAYNWFDLQIPAYVSASCSSKRGQMRFRNGVIDRLFELNTKRIG